MKVKLTLIDGTRKRFNHVAYVSADKKNNEILIARDIYKSNILKERKIETFSELDIAYMAVIKDEIRT